MQYIKACTFLPYQVLIEKKKAVGVEVIKDGKKHVVRSNKEVILSAGTVGSPHILMLSGVGPKKHLQEHKVSASTLHVTNRAWQQCITCITCSIKISS